MGLDPGLVATGFAVLEALPGAVTVVDSGVITTSSTQPLEARLNAIYRAVHQLIETQKPTFLVVEDLYSEYKFPRTAILMGHARGVVYLAARQLGVSVTALAPSEVKRAMTGNGSAGKAQVQRGVQTLLGLQDLPRPSHVADALGLAVAPDVRGQDRLVPLVDRVVADRLPEQVVRDRPHLQVVLLEDVEAVAHVRLVLGGTPYVEMVTPAGDLQALVPPGGRQPGHLLERQVGPLAGEQRDGTGHRSASLVRLKSAGA
jgi:crossover junction endodeoxyribonuclease RuvC